MRVSLWEGKVKMKGLITFNFGSFVKSKQPVVQTDFTPEHCFAPCSTARALPYNALLPFNFRTCHWASDSENWPNRGLAAGTFQLIGRVPKPCSKSQLAKRSSGFLPEKHPMGVWATGCKRPVAQTLSINYAYDNRTTKNVHNCIQYSLYLMTLYGMVE